AVVLCCTCGFPVTEAWDWSDFLVSTSNKHNCEKVASDSFDGIKCADRKNWENKLLTECTKNRTGIVEGEKCSDWLLSERARELMKSSSEKKNNEMTGLPTTIILKQQENEAHSQDPSANSDNTREGSSESHTNATTTQTKAIAPANDNPSPNTTAQSSGHSDVNSVTQPTAAAGITQNNNSANADTNNANTPNNEELTTTTTTTTTTTRLPPVPDSQISNTIASTVLRNKANVDSSLCPVWIRTAAPLLVVIVLVSVTVY
ncbi:uncharacterized protein TM35_000601300, partial [Trypanosoma theileri]